MRTHVRAVITATNTWEVVVSIADFQRLRNEPKLLEDLIVNLDPVEASPVLTVKPNMSGPIRPDEPVATLEEKRL